MIASISGTVAYVGDAHLVIQVGGIGVQVFVPQRGGSAPIGEAITLYTTLLMGDKGITLYGFNSPSEKRLFDLLLEVSGVGPKHALAVLSTMSPNDIVVAIISGDSNIISAVPGIGKRTAARIGIDLQSKLEKEWGQDIGGSIGFYNEISIALQALGYSLPEIQKAVMALGNIQDITLEEQVRLALRQLAGE